MSKTLVPFSDSGRFTLQIDAQSLAVNVGNLGSTGPQTLTPGLHQIGEEGATLQDYSVTICGDCTTAGNVFLQGSERKTCSIMNFRPVAEVSACLEFCDRFHRGCLEDPDDLLDPQQCARILAACRQQCSPRGRRLSVARHVTTRPLSAGDADRIFGEMSNLLRVVDGEGDVACDVPICRRGEVSLFTLGDGTINSLEDFRAIIALPGNVKIVNEINWCGGITSAVGCADGDGNFVVRRAAGFDVEGSLWAHEYGHTQGLGHRNDDIDNVMFAAVGGRKINAEECQELEP